MIPHKIYCKLLFHSTIFVCLTLSIGCLKLEPYKGVFMNGKIIYIKKSGNHSFGVYSIDIDSISMPDYRSLKDRFLPFIVNTNKAEIYTTISIDDSINFSLTLLGDSNLVIVKDRLGRDISKGYLTDVIDATNKRFISENSKLVGRGNVSD